MSAERAATIRGVGLALLVGVIPAAVVGWLYHTDLGHRRDYLGHFAAGYGGSLCALACGLVVVPRSVSPRVRGWAVVVGTLLCIGLGTITEATIFRYAKFDPIDYGNQNLGAVLAGIVVSAAIARRPLPFLALASWLPVGLAFLYTGFHHAFR